MIEASWVALAYGTMVLIVIFGIDDLFIDLVYFFGRLSPRLLSEEELSALHFMPQKRIAIMIANWHEDEIIERMIQGNIGRIDYHNYDIFLGVYPNDPKTMVSASKLEAKFSNVHVVVNSKNGPTSKGQMLNVIVTTLRALEIKNHLIFEVLLLHDSEDILHPLSLKLINWEMERFDFVQIPVLSLPTSWLDFTRGTYIDEFAESHTRNMLVRSYLKGGVPSAGVGTAFSRLFVAEVLIVQDDQLLKEDTLTEDYHLGLVAHRMGYDCTFSCRLVQKKAGPEFIATREYFPSLVKMSIKQKSRWVLGICIQGYSNLKWSTTLAENYFLWRDRRSLIQAPIMISSYGLTLSFTLYYFVTGEWPEFLVQNESIRYLVGIGLALMIYRFTQRVQIVISAYGFKLAPFVLLRWILANYINTMASFAAIRQQIQSIRSGQQPNWVKTTHELPLLFGVEPHSSLQESPDTLSNRKELERPSKMVIP